MYTSESLFRFRGVFKNLCMRGPTMLENWEMLGSSPVRLMQERLEKVCGHTANGYVSEKSGTNVIPEKEPNNAAFPKQ